MKIDLEKIQELYGESIINEMKNHFDNIIENLSYLKKKQISNYDEVLESYPYLFMLSSYSFQKKINQIIKKNGKSI